ncbi:PAS domain S-box protein [Hufsiella ginkgonis]|uniref:histidine kinase n=1 Tax=Hufsiella ginkgonis TaxID=2695274 RepID=A0A7K1XZX3_9SPHI|nr:PAS domain S-box protein [Hufsiella ginkgonis]MXV16492.1 PAS domain S-box protein [Hufsiella ginkgonis]
MDQYKPVNSVEEQFKQALEKEQALNEELATTNEELAAANEELTVTNEELNRARESLAVLNGQLENLVAMRTAALTASEHKTRGIVENAPFPIGVYTGRELRIELANQAIMDVWGKGNEVIGKRYTEILPELKGSGIFEQLDGVFTTGIPFHARNQRVDLVIGGTLKTFYFNYSFTALRDNEGIIYAVMNTAADVTDVVLAKQQVEQSEKNLQNMILQAPVAMCIMLGPDHVVEVANDLMIALWGKPAHQVMKKPIFEGLPDARGQGLEQLLGNVYQTAVAFKASEQPVSLLRNGKYEMVYQNLVYEPYKDAAGNTLGIIAATIDVTEQVMARKTLEKSHRDQQEVNEELAASNEELAAVNEELTAINEELIETQEDLSRSEKLFKSIAVNIPGSMVIVIDKNHRFVAIEGDLMKKLGYDGNDYVGKHPSEVSPPERYEASKYLYDRVLSGEQFSVERKSATGEIFMVHMVPLKNEVNEVYAGLIIALDISEIKAAEEKSAKLAAIIHTSDDAIISKTLEGIITSWNHSAERIFGYTEQEMIGQSILKLIPTDRHEEEPRIIGRLKRGERVEHFETKRITRDGREIDISLTISPVTDPQGNIIGVSKIARDISEKKLEEVRKNDFIAMVSHELKTPLTSMNSYVQILLSKARKQDDSFAVNALTRAGVQAKKMTTMIADFLSLARLEEGKIHLSKQSFALCELLDEIVTDARYLTTKHRIHYDDHPDLLVNADRDKIGQVLINLLSNAIKYSPKGGDINIRCERLDGKVKISVIDEGVGVSEADQQRLFDRFYRVKNEKMRTVSGFGIGLYLVSEILNYHNSSISVISKEDVGSTFFFYLDEA